MAKKITLELGNRKIKKPEVIEDTHANINNDNDVKITKKRKQRAKKDWIVKTIRFEQSEYDKIEEFLEKENIGFSKMIKKLFEEKGIL
jgi:predicted DNA-binding ribbon-helix-helix protein